MHLRPPARLLAVGGALALATVLSSCGFNYATDRIYTPAAGVNDRTTDVDILGAVVVSGQDGSGTFIASFANNDPYAPAIVESLTGGGDTAELEIAGFEPIEIPAGQLVNLADDGGLAVTGDYVIGDFVTIVVSLGDGQSATIDIPVVPPCDEFADLDTSAPDSEDTYDCEVAPPVGTGEEH